MEVKHTPGPWIVHGDFENLRVGNPESSDERACDEFRQVCHVVQGGYEISDYNEANANARLIAAAPELLAACEDALSKINDAADGKINWRRDFGDRLRAAIAKATQQ